MTKTNKKKSKNNLVLISTIFGVIILIMGFFIYNGYRKYLLSKDIVCSYYENGEEVLKYIYVYNDEGKLDYLIEKRLVIDNTETHNFYKMYTEEVEKNPKKFKGVYATLSELDGSRFRVQYIFDLNNMNSDDLDGFYGISVKDLQSKSKNYIKNEYSYSEPLICK